MVSELKLLLMRSTKLESYFLPSTYFSHSWKDEYKAGENFINCYIHSWVSMVANSTDVLAQLATCRESGGYVNETVQICLQWILKQDYPRDADGSQHWYCERAFLPDVMNDEQERRALDETRTFLVRLRSLNRKSVVAVWAANVDQLLLKCSGCVQGWEASKYLFIKQYVYIISCIIFIRCLCNRLIAFVESSLDDSFVWFCTQISRSGLFKTACWGF